MYNSFFRCICNASGKRLLSRIIVFTLMVSIIGTNININNVAYAEDAKVEDSKVEDTKVEDTKIEDTKVEDTKIEDTKVEDTKIQNTKVETTKVQIATAFNFYKCNINEHEINQIVDSYGYFGDIPVVMDAPIDSSFKLFNNSNVFIDFKAYDFKNNKPSDTEKNADMIVIREIDDEGNVKGNDIKVESSMEGKAISIKLIKPLKYETNYQLVVKKGFSKWNQSGSKFNGVLSDVQDTTIPFKTAKLLPPTLSSAILEKDTLRLEGLPEGHKLKYNLAIDGEFSDDNWIPFEYTYNTVDISVSDLEITGNSKIVVGYDVEGDVIGMISKPIPISIILDEKDKPAPSFAGAEVYGKELTLNGLPPNSKDIEYKISELSEWTPIETIGTSISVSVDNMNLSQVENKIQVRYKGSDNVTEREFYYTISKKGSENEIPLRKGEETLMTEGVKIYSEDLSEEKDNTVTVRYSKGERVPTKNNMGFAEQNDTYLIESGGVYGFNFKNAGEGKGNKVKITLPLKMPNNIDTSKAAIYKLTEFVMDNGQETYQMWRLIDNTVVNSKDNTATVEITDEDLYKGRSSKGPKDYEGKDIILAVKSDITPPTIGHIQVYSKADDSMTLTFNSGDWSGMKEYKVRRVTRGTNDEKIITMDTRGKSHTQEEFASGNVESKLCEVEYKEGYEGPRNNKDTYVGEVGQDAGTGGWYTDRDVEIGKKYDYYIISATDRLGNESFEPFNSKSCLGTIDSSETLVKEVKGMVLNSLEKVETPEAGIRFRGNDNRNSVTSNIELPRFMLRNQVLVTWKSKSKDTVRIFDVRNPESDSNYNYIDDDSEYSGLTVMNPMTEINLPVDKDGNPGEPKESMLIATIIAEWRDPVTKKTDRYKEDVEVPIVVKWDLDKVNKKVTINRELQYMQLIKKEDFKVRDRYFNSNLEDLIKASKFSNKIVDTIVLDSSVYITKDLKSDIPRKKKDWQIDLNGKTIQQNFDGDLFYIFEYGSNLTIKNATIDMNHKVGRVNRYYEHDSSYILNLENVKIINAENCDLGGLKGTYEVIDSKEPPVVTPPVEPPVVTPPIEPPVVIPPVEPPVVTPPIEPPVVIPPVEPPVVTPPIEPPVVTPPIEPPVVIPPTDPKEDEDRINPDGIGNKTEGSVKVSVTRETDEKGNKIDKVDLSEKDVKSLIEKAIESKTNSILLVIPHTKDDKAEIVKIKLSKESLKELKNSKMDLKVISEKGEVNISKETIKSLKNEDINISIGEVKDDKSLLETKAVIESLHKNAKILSTPLKIETKITSETSPIEVIIPLKKGEFDPKNLAVVVEHSDDTRETLKGEVIYGEKGEVLGVSVKVKKFSTFTVVELSEDKTPPTPPSDNGSSGSSDSGGSSHENVWIKPDGIDDKTEGSVEIPVSRETDDKGNKTDKVSLSENKLKEVITKALDSKSDSGTIVVPYMKNDSAESVNVYISKKSIEELKNSNLGLTIISEKGEFKVSKETIKSLKNDDINILIGEVKDNKKISETKGIIETLHKDVKILSNPLKIETKPTLDASFKVVIPIEKGSFNKDNLAVVAIHDDGTKETLKGEVIYNDKSEPIGIGIVVKKLGTFTVVELDKPLALSEGDIASIRLPLDVKMQGSEIVGQVENNVTKKIVYVNVSSKATWKLYKDEACTEEIKNKTMKLNVGTNKAYIKVTSEDGKTSKVYTVKINRSEK